MDCPILTEMEEKISRLPRWAQDEINRLENQLAECNKLIRGYSQANDKTRISIEPLFNEKVYIKEDEKIYFEVGDRKELIVELDGSAIRRGDSVIPVIITSSDKGCMMVRPCVSNQVEIHLK